MFVKNKNRFSHGILKSQCSALFQGTIGQWKYTRQNTQSRQTERLIILLHLAFLFYLVPENTHSKSPLLFYNCELVAHTVEYTRGNETLMRHIDYVL